MNLKLAESQTASPSPAGLPELMDAKFTLRRSRADNAYGNTFMEACFSRFKAELMQNGAFDNKADTQTEIFEYMKCITTLSESMQA